MPLEKKKKKKEEFDASLMTGYLPGASMPNFIHTPTTQSANMEWAKLPPFSFEVPTPGTSFIDNYLMYFFLPSPFEQLGTLFDPASIQEPPHRYLQNPSLLIFDIHADARSIQSMWNPGPWRVLGWDSSLPPGGSQPGLTEGKYISPASQ